jgi:RNA polymerase sigma factor (sigma-70 family)
MVNEHAKHGVLPDTMPGLPDRLRNSEDTEAWAYFRRSYSRVFRAVAVGKEGLDDFWADELEQRILVAVARSVGTYDRTRCKFRVWLWAVYRHRLQEVLRDRGPRASLPPVGVAELATSEEPVEPAAPCPLDEVWREEENHLLRDCCLIRLKHQVKPEKYQIFEARKLHEKSTKETAEAFGKSASHVDKIVSEVQGALDEIARQVKSAYDAGELLGDLPDSVTKGSGRGNPG